MPKSCFTFWRSGRVVKAFDSNFPSTILGIKSIRGQEFESLGRRHRFCFCSPDGGEWGGRDGSQVFWLGKDGVVCFG
jgi:hypothetical protein